MRTCWSLAGTTRCWRSHAAMSPARDRRRGRYCRTARSQTRADSEPPPTSLRARRDLTSSVRPLVFFFLLVELPEQLGKAIRDSGVHDIVIHSPQLLPDLALDVASKPASGSSLSYFGLHRSGPVRLIVICHHNPRPLTVFVIAGPHPVGYNARNNRLFQTGGNFFCEPALTGPQPRVGTSIGRFSC